MATRQHRTRAAAPKRVAKTLVDHDEIRRWAGARGGTPARLLTTTGDDVLRLDFPGYTGEGKLEPIGWDEWFEKFDAANLALLVQDTTASGHVSHFNKLVARKRSPRPHARAHR